MFPRVGCLCCPVITVIVWKTLLQERNLHRYHEQCRQRSPSRTSCSQTGGPTSGLPNASPLSMTPSSVPQNHLPLPRVLHSANWLSRLLGYCHLYRPFGRANKDIPPSANLWRLSLPCCKCSVRLKTWRTSASHADYVYCFWCRLPIPRYRAWKR